MMIEDAKKETVHLTGMEKALERRLEIDRIIAELERERQSINQTFQFLMGDSTTAYIGKNKISWNNVESSRLDFAKLREEQPEIYEQYLVKTSSRRFSIKAA